MTNFFKNMKDLFTDIPSKAKFLEDLGLGNSFVGFRYFLQGRNEEPSEKFMKKLCDELEYDYIQVPAKRGESNELLDDLTDQFNQDLKQYLEKYEGDPTRSPNKPKTDKSTVSAAVAAFEIEKELLEPKERIDVSDLF